MFEILGPAQSKESPPQEDDDKQTQPRKGAVLFQHQLPIDSDGRLPVFLAVLSQSSAHLTHLFQAVSTVQQVLYVLGHDFGHVLELIIQLVEIAGRACVLIRLLRLLDEPIEFDVGIRPQRRREVLPRRVNRGEFLRQIRQIREGELSRVGSIGDAEKADRVPDEVVQRVHAGLDAGFLSRVSVQPAEDEFGLRLDFGQLVLGVFVVNGSG